MQAEGGVLGYRHVGEQGVVLEHHGGAALLRRQPGDVAAIEADGAAVQRHEPGDGAQDGGLAAAAGAQQSENGALVDAQRDPVDRRRITVTS